MSYLAILKKIKEDQHGHGVQATNHNSLNKMSISKFSELKMAFQVYSEVLKCEVWFCSNDAMAKQIMNDDPEAITYTVDEIMNLIKLNPNPAELTKIHQAKEVFRGSRIIDSELRNELKKED